MRFELLQKISCSVLFLLMCNMLALPLWFPVAKADLTFTQITIRPDGTIVPSNEYTPIVTDDNFTYRLINDIGHSEFTNYGIALCINRSDMVLDGAGHRIYWAGMGYYPTGIYFSNVNNVTIENLCVDVFYPSLKGEGCSQINIINDTISSGVFLYSCSHCNIIGNYIKPNPEGIIIGGEDNLLASNFVNGTSFQIGGSNCSIVGNTATGSTFEMDASNSTVSLNSMTGPGLPHGWIDCGIIIGGSDDYCTENNVTGFDSGFLLNGGWNDSFVGNTVQHCRIGMNYNDGGNATFYWNNMIGNSIDGVPMRSAWDNGYPMGGNYWGDVYVWYIEHDYFHGPFQNETGGDGIGDVYFAFGAYDVDRYPLMEPYVGLHNVGIVAIDLSKTVVGQGSCVNVSAEVVNYGEAVEDFNVTLAANSTAIWTETETLLFRSSATFEYTWNTTGLFCGNYTLLASASNENCTYTRVCNVIITIQGDIKGDSDVNIFDAILLSNAYNSTPDSPNWNPNADINSDGTVNILDAIILSNHYLQHYP